METMLDMTKDVAPRFTVTIRLVGLKKWKVRLWVATKLIKLGALIMNVGIKFEDKPYHGADL